MSVEKSVFTSPERLMSFLYRSYDLAPTQIKKLEQGSANCYQVQTPDGAYFLKEFQTDFDISAVQREIQVCALLWPEIPTSRFLKNRAGAVVCQENGRLLHLQYFINGTAPAQNTLDGERLEQAAVMLARIQQALDGRLFLPDGFPDTWFTSWSKKHSIEKYQALSQDAPETPWREAVIAACETKIRLLEEYTFGVSGFRKLCKTNSHGDYNNNQLLFEPNGQLAAVIDFSSAAYLPAVWELLRAYTYSAPECRAGNALNLVALKAYVDAYLRIRPLPLFDLTHMAEFYCYHMLRSAYGLDSTDEATVRFALWRTRLCEYLCRNFGAIGAFFADEYTQ